MKGVPVHVYVTHLDYRPDPSVRMAQVADTRPIMAEDRGRKVLLGDFNAEPGAPELAPLWNELADADPGAPTFPALDPVKRIDFVAVSKDGVRVRDAAVAERLASDHRPLSPICCSGAEGGPDQFVGRSGRRRSHFPR